MTISSLKYKTSSSFLTAPAEIDLGAMIPLMTTTLSADTGSVTFSNIPQNYEHLQIRCIVRNILNLASSTNLKMNFNSDTGANYTAHWLYGNGATASSSGFVNQNGFYFVDLPRGGIIASVYAGFVIDILDYTNTNKYKTAKALGGFDCNGSGGYVGLSSGVWLNSNAVTSINLSASGETLTQYSSFALYGIKRAGV